MMGSGAEVPDPLTDDSTKQSTGRDGVVTYTDWTEPSVREAERILEAMAPKDVRMAFNTDDGKYKYGQVKESKELGFLDPLGLAKFTARYARSDDKSVRVLENIVSYNAKELDIY